MLSPEFATELRRSWLPHVTDSGLDRLVELLERASPLLIRGSFARAVPMGCLASHIAWHHPETAQLSVEAGIQWLAGVAGLNPATSQVVRQWDAAGPHDFAFRSALLGLLRAERERRRTPAPAANDGLQAPGVRRATLASGWPFGAPSVGSAN